MGEDGSREGQVDDMFSSGSGRGNSGAGGNTAAVFSSAAKEGAGNKPPRVNEEALVTALLCKGK